MRRLPFLFLFIFLSSEYAQAEYRVYQYFVKAKHTFLQDNPSYTVISSLDPVSYVAYHGGSSNIGVDLLRTWICPGHTGGKKEYCKSPYKTLAAANN